MTSVLMAYNIYYTVNVPLYEAVMTLATHVGQSVRDLWLGGGLFCIQNSSVACGLGFVIVYQLSIRLMSLSISKYIS